MRNFTKHTIAVAFAVAAVAAATPSFAQTQKHHVARHEMQPQNEYQGTNSLPPPGSGEFQVPGYVTASPNQCWSDEGYGRYSSCDGGGG